MIKSSMEASSLLTPDDCTISLKSLKVDQFNKERGHRKSYPIDFKIRAIALKDSGLGITAIANILGTAKGNIEKWCSTKITTHTSLYITFTRYIS